MGGILGKTVILALVKIFNYPGVTVILWSLAIILLIFYTERPAAVVLGWPLKMLTRLTTKSNLRYTLSWLAIPFKKKKTVLPLDGQVSSRPIGMPKLKGKGFKFDLRGSNSSKTLKTKFSLSTQLTPWKKSWVGKGFVKPRKIKNWNLPPASLLNNAPFSTGKIDDREIRNKANLLIEKFGQFSVRGKIQDIKPGPSVTMFEFKPEADVKISKITELADDISLALSSESVRIIAPIPGRDVVGIETSNRVREKVYLKDLISVEDFWREDFKIPVTLGRYVDGEPAVVDLRKMPHMLVAGTTGSGKSVFVVSMITSLLFRHSPESLRCILIDPKQVDLAVFRKIPHLLIPPVRDSKKAVAALKWAIREMEKRYRSLAKFGANSIESFNQKVAVLDSEEKQKHFKKNAETPESGEGYYFTPQPFILVAVEEFGDLMAVDKVNVEQAVVRLAQMARACGIHLILAMQSPRRDVVTGLIKTNIPGRIAFKVASKMDSRIILDESGAERLLACGDMLFLAPGVSRPKRVHGPWGKEDEIERVTEFWSQQGEAQYDAGAMAALKSKSGLGPDFQQETEETSEEIYDEKYDEILSYVSSLKEVSASLLQRRFRLGYPRAARVIEVFEQEGVVGPPQGSKPRQVLVR